jgi:hypothetical protein
MPEPGTTRGEGGTGPSITGCLARSGQPTRNQVFWDLPSLSQNTQQLVQQGGDLGEDRVQTGWAVQQPRHRAQQVPEQVPRSRLGGDVQVDRVQVHLKPE